MTAKEARAITNQHPKNANYFIKQINELIAEAAAKGKEYLTVPIEDELLKNEILHEVKNYYETNGFHVYISETFIFYSYLKIEW